MCLVAYCASLVVYQIGGLITGEVGFHIFTIVAEMCIRDRFCGSWNCYGDPAAAQKTFERFRKCTEVYLRCFQSCLLYTSRCV